MEFHGHLCPGLVLGYIAAKEAMKAMDVIRAEDEELVAIVENDSCAADAIQVITGCTFGKGNFIFHDFGKQVYTLLSRKTRQGVRLVLKRDIRKPKKPDGSTDRPAFIHQLLNGQIIDFFNSTRIETELPPLARIFDNAVCDNCGEEVMLPRVREKNGRKLCSPCFDAQASKSLIGQSPTSAVSKATLFT
ncbi:MAG: TraR/DksA C4-type zinc finger protein [Deltaproteobacteria bacterium]|nr:TraR/DksA C4-type zinc finger protein [Deltaproteobacteria bacterium]